MEASMFSMISMFNMHVCACVHAYMCVCMCVCMGHPPTPIPTPTPMHPSATPQGVDPQNQ